MKHPQHFLSPGRELTPGQWEELRNESSSSRDGPEPDETTFIFEARSILDNYDRTIVANRSTNRFRCLRVDHCCCLRNPLECECNEAACGKCGEKLTAMTSACSSEFCVNDECPLCEHQRENCMYQEILESIRQVAARNVLDLNESIALAHVSAIGGVLAPGIGESPLFPATMRVLDELLGGDHDPVLDAMTGGQGLEWTCTDGSRVKRDPSSPAWLTWDDPDEDAEKEK